MEQQPGPLPSYDELATLVVLLKDELAGVRAELEGLRSRAGELEAENAELERRLGRNPAELLDASVGGWDWISRRRGR